jgi:hypothetical protein
MSNSVELNARISEIAEKIENGVKTAEIVAEYAPKWSVSERTLDRYIALAKDIIAGKLKKQQAWIEAMRAEATEAATENLASNLEIEARLCQIVTGTYETEKVVRGKQGEFIKVGCNPNPRDAMKAAEMLFKLRSEQANLIKRQEQEDELHELMAAMGNRAAEEFLAKKAAQRNGK